MEVNELLKLHHLQLGTTTEVSNLSYTVMFLP